MLAEHKQSQIPATPPLRAQQGGGRGGGVGKGGGRAADSEDDAGVDPTANSATCPSCHVWIEYLAADKEDIGGDYYLVDDRAYCRYCDARVEDLDEA